MRIAPILAASVTGLALPAALVAQTPQQTTQQQQARASTAARAAAQAGQQLPPAQTMLVLVKSSIIALNQANLTGVYQVLHGLGSDRFRTNNTPDSLANHFAGFRQNNVDLSSTILIAPQLARQPTIEGGRLHLVGFFPTNPLRVTFDMFFEPSQGRWKLADLNVALAQPQAAAAHPPQRQAQPIPQPRQR